MTAREIYNGILSMLSGYTTAGREWAAALGMAETGGGGRRSGREGGVVRPLKASVYESSGASAAGFRRWCGSHEILRCAAPVGIDATRQGPRRNVASKVGCQFER